MKHYRVAYSPDALNAYLYADGTYNRRRVAQQKARLFMRFKRKIEKVDVQTKVFDDNKLVSHFVWRDDKIIDIHGAS